MFNPAGLFADMYDSPRSVRFGWIFSLGFAMLYSFTALHLYLQGWTPKVSPSINLPFDNYYLYQTFFTIPVAMSALFLGTILAYWFSHILGSDSSLKGFWGPICVAAVIPSFFTMWLIETLYYPFTTPDQLPPEPYDLMRVIIGSSWTLVLTIIAIQRTSRISWIKSVFVGLITTGTIGSIMGYFFR